MKRNAFQTEKALERETVGEAFRIPGMLPERNGMDASRNTPHRSRRGTRAERGLTLREQRLLALITAWEAAYAAGMRPEERDEPPRIVSLGLPFVGRPPRSPDS